MSRTYLVRMEFKYETEQSSEEFLAALLEDIQEGNGLLLTQAVQEKESNLNIDVNKIER